MNLNIKTFLLCSIPEDQKPINDYIQIKDNFFLNWIQFSQKSYPFQLLKLFFFWFGIIGIFLIDEFFKNFRFWIFVTTNLSFFIFFLFFCNIIFQLQTLSDRFIKARLVYEEGSWYDTEIWEKPISIIKNDKLINNQKLVPLISKIKKTFVFCFLIFLAINSFLEILLQFIV
jgi:signal transduction histidine kinase